MHSGATSNNTAAQSTEAKSEGEGLVWMIGAVVCLCAAPQVQLFISVGNGWPHNVPWYH